MKKIYVFLYLTLAVVFTANADSKGIKLTFSGATSASIDNGVPKGINVAVDKAEGTNTTIDGISAELTNVSFTKFQTANACKGGNILAPVNGEGYANQQNSTITYTFKISGLNKSITQINQIDLGIAGLNSEGKYQGNMVRSWNIDVKQGTSSTESDLDEFASKDVNLTNVVTNSVNYQTHSLVASATAETSDEMYIMITLKKTDSQGCFAGLQDIEIYYNTYSIVEYGMPTGTTYTFGEKTGISAGDTDVPILDGDSYTAESLTVSLPDGASEEHVVKSLTKNVFYVFYLRTAQDQPTTINKIASIGKVATEIVEDQWYIINQNHWSGSMWEESNRYVYDNKGSYNFKSSVDNNSLTPITTDNYLYLFRFISTGVTGVYYIQGADGKYFGEAADNNVSKDNDVTLQATNPGYPYKVQSVGNGFYFQCISNNVVLNNNAGGRQNVVGWSTDVPTSETSNAVWRIYPVTLVDYDNATWQTMANGSSSSDGELAYYDIANENNIPVKGKGISATPSLSNWALVSNSDGGYYIINQYQYANDNTLKFLAPSSIEEATVGFSATPQSWQTESTTTSEGVQGLRFYLTENGTKYYLVHYNFNKSSETKATDNKLVLSSVGNANYWYFTKAPTEINSSYLTALISTAKVYSGNIGSGYNKYTYSTNDTTASTKDEFDKLIPEDVTTYNNQAEVDVAYNKLNTAIANTGINLPKWEKTTSLIRIYYTPDGGTTKYYLSDGTSNKGESNLAVTTNAVDSTVWFYDSNNLWSYKSGFNLDCTNQKTAADVSAGIGFNEATGNVKGQGYYLIAGVNNGNTTNYLNISSSAVSFSSSESEAGHLNLEEVTSFDISLTPSSDGNCYASLYLPRAFTVSGATAYKGAVSDNTITLSALEESTVIPENTAVIIVGSSESATIKLSDSEGTTIDENELSGQGTATLVSRLAETGKTTYCLGKKGNVVGFYTIGNGYYIANKAYINKATNGGSKGFVFAFADDDPTGINNATEKNADCFDADAPRYDLKGVRVGKDYKGIVIINGKKYLIM